MTEVAGATPEVASLEELQERREGLVWELQRNGIDLATVFQELYARPDHFVLELLQNAQDCGAQEVEFILTQDVLEFRHRGGNDFTLRDIDAITSLGNSTKPTVESEARIGRFGVGFKSVFGICAEPVIHSGPYHVRIVRQFVPCSIEPLPLEPLETKFLFKLRDAGNHELIATALRNLDVDVLLHLDRVTKLRAVVDGEDVRSIERIAAPWDRDPQVEHVVLGNPTSTLEYLLFSRSVEHLPGLRPGNRVQIVWPFREGAIDVEDRTTCVSAFFPLDGYSVGNHPFGFQAPFLTTPARDQVLEAHSGNEALWRELLDLLEESLIDLGRLGYLSPAVWGEFDIGFVYAPTPTETQKLRNRIIEVIRSTTAQGHPMLPGLEGQPVCAGHARLVMSTDIVEMVSDRVLRTATCNSEASWILPDLPCNTVLHQFLAGRVGVKCFGFPELCRAFPLIDQELDRLDWNLKFLQILQKQGLDSLDKPVTDSVLLRNYPLLLDADNQRHPLATGDLEERIYLKARRKAEVAILHPAVQDEEKLVQFLVAAGIGEYDELEELRRTVEPLYDERTVKRLGFAGATGILQEVADNAEVLGDRIRRLYEDLKENAYLPALDATGTPCVRAVNELYFDDTEWGRELLSRIPGTYFVPKEWACNADIRSITEAMGASAGPRVVTTRIRSMAGAVEFRHRRGWQATARLHEPDAEDASIEFLEKLLASPSPELTKLVCQELILGQVDKKYRRTKYSWLHYSRQHVLLDSHWVHLLRSQSWFVGGGNAARKPEDVSVDEVLQLGCDVSPQQEADIIDAFDFRPSQRHATWNGLPSIQKECLDEIGALSVELQKELLTHIREMKQRQLDLMSRNHELNLTGGINTEAQGSDRQNSAEVLKEAPAFDVSFISTTAATNTSGPSQQDGVDGDMPDDTIPPVDCWEISTVDMPEPRRVRDPDWPQDSSTHEGGVRDFTPGDDVNRAPPNRLAAQRAEESVLQKVLSDRLPPGASWTVKSSGVWCAQDQYGTWIEIHHGNAGGISEGWDIAVRVDGEIVELVEVKSTYSDSEFFDISASQWQMARRMDNQRHSFTLAVVRMELDSSPPRAKIMWLDGLMQRWRSGEVSCDPVRVHVRFPT